MRTALKKLVRKILTLFPRWITDPLFGLKHRISWSGRRMKNEHVKYFNEYLGRSEMVVHLENLLREHPRTSVRIFEFGCSGGNNLRLFRESLSVPVHYTGIDLSAKAIEFARQNFAGDSFHVGDEQKAAHLLKTCGPFDVFIAGGVLAYLPEEPCRKILQEAAKSCDLLVVSDLLARFLETEGAEEGVFLHPYGRLCMETGWKVTGNVRPPESINVYGVFSATSSERDHAKTSVL